MPRFCLTGTNTLICLCTAVRWQNKRREERRKKWREQGQNVKARETRRKGGWAKQSQRDAGEERRREERKMENKGKTNRALRKRNLSSGNNEGKVRYV